MAAPAVAPTKTKLVTAKELLQLSGKGRYELVKGELIEMSPPGYEHGSIVMNLAVPIANHARQNGLGRVLAAETGFRLSRNPDTVRAPDVAFVVKDRLPTKPLKGYADFAPDLIAEVVSPSDDPDDVQTKVKEWLDAGVRLALVVYPGSKQMAVYRSLREVTILTEGDIFSANDLLPGLSVNVADIFAL
jgi:Uma2 family endonuclease